jgi:hypothetical protein
MDTWIHWIHAQMHIRPIDISSQVAADAREYGNACNLGSGVNVLICLVSCLPTHAFSQCQQYQLTTEDS